MLEYELSVNIKVENKEALQNLLLTVESINATSLDASSVELLSISRLNTSNTKQSCITKNYEQDSWLSPLTVKPTNII